MLSLNVTALKLSRPSWQYFPKNIQYSPDCEDYTSHETLPEVSLDVPIGPGYGGVWQGWMGTPSLQQPVDLGKISL